MGFDPKTWMLMTFYFFLLVVCTHYLCFSLSTCVSIIDGLFLLSTVYMFGRLLHFRGIVNGHDGNVTRSAWPLRWFDRANVTRSAWPLRWFDRATSVVIGPGITGFCPWSSQSSN